MVDIRTVPRSNSANGEDVRGDDLKDRLTPAGREDAPAWAGRIVADEVSSILEAAGAMASEIDAAGHRDADAVKRQADEAIGDAAARLDALSSELEALSAELSRRIDDRSVSGHGR